MMSRSATTTHARPGGAAGRVAGRRAPWLGRGAFLRPPTTAPGSWPACARADLSGGGRGPYARLTAGVTLPPGRGDSVKRRCAAARAPSPAALVGLAPFAIFTASCRRRHADGRSSLAATASSRAGRAPDGASPTPPRAPARARYSRPPGCPDPPSPRGFGRLGVRPRWLMIRPAGFAAPARWVNLPAPVRPRAFAGPRRRRAAAGDGRAHLLAAGAMVARPRRRGRELGPNHAVVRFPLGASVRPVSGGTSTLPASSFPSGHTAIPTPWPTPRGPSMSPAVAPPRSPWPPASAPLARRVVNELRYVSAWPRGEPRHAPARAAIALAA